MTNWEDIVELKYNRKQSWCQKHSGLGVSQCRINFVFRTKLKSLA